MAQQNRLYSFVLDYTCMIAPSPTSSGYVTGFTQPMLASTLTYIVQDDLQLLLQPPKS